MIMETEIRIPKKTALFLLRHELLDPEKAIIVCKDYANDDGDFVEIMKEDIDDEWDEWLADKEYTWFELWLRDSYITTLTQQGVEIEK